MEDIKKLIAGTMDEKLEVIEEITRQRLIGILGEAALPPCERGVYPPAVAIVPSCLEYIVTEVSVARFNRIRSEGTSSHSLSGESMTFLDDDFAPYMGDIRRWMGRQQAAEGTVRFL